MNLLKEKVSIVTGASRGMGEAIARRFIQEGAYVVLTDVMDEVGREIAEELGSRAIYCSLDVRKEDQWERVVESTLKSWNSIDILVNNAGIAQLELLSEMSLTDYQRIIDVNQTGVFLGMKACIPAMKKAGGGSIINNSSIGGVVGQTGFGAYNASKHAVIGLTKAAALELASYNIRVNAVLPGGIDTPMGSSTKGSEKLDLEANTLSYPMKRLGTVEEISGLFCFLASSDSSYISGASIKIDGAWTAGILMTLKPEYQ